MHEFTHRIAELDDIPAIQKVDETINHPTLGAIT